MGQGAQNGQRDSLVSSESRGGRLNIDGSSSKSHLPGLALKDFNEDLARRLHKQCPDAGTDRLDRLDDIGFAGLEVIEGGIEIIDGHAEMIDALRARAT